MSDIYVTVEEVSTSVTVEESVTEVIIATEGIAGPSGAPGPQGDVGPAGTGTAIDTGLFSLTGHNHDADYYPLNSNPSGYLEADELEEYEFVGTGGIAIITGIETGKIYISGEEIDTGLFSPIGHDHNEDYYPLNSNPSGYLVAENSSTLLVGVNKFGSILSRGTAVYISGAQGNRPKIWPALASTENQSPSHFVIGLVENDISNNQTGLVRTAGVLYGYNTSSFSDGDTLFLSNTVSGGLVKDPYVDKSIENVRLGYSLNSTPNGAILVDVFVPENIEDLHHVATNGKQDGDVLYWDASTGLWKNKQINTYVYLTGQTTLNYDDAIAECSGTFNVYLGLASGHQKRKYTIKNSATGIVSILASGAETIDEEASIDIYQHDSLSLVSNGSNWIII